jgi:hypothetical protein
VSITVSKPGVGIAVGRYHLTHLVHPPFSSDCTVLTYDCGHLSPLCEAAKVNPLVEADFGPNYAERNVPVEAASTTFEFRRSVIQLTVTGANSRPVHAKRFEREVSEQWEVYNACGHRDAVIHPSNWRT